MPQPFRRTALLAACSATALLGLTACSPDAATPSAAPAAPVASGSAASSAAPTSGQDAGTAGLPNGVKLKAMLLPDAAIPHTLHLDPSSTKGTGDGFNPPASPSAFPHDKACERINSTGWIDVAGIEGASFAQANYMDDSQNLFGQELDAFRGNEAQTAMANLKNVLTACHSFTGTENGQNYPATVKLQSLPGVGDEALQAVITSPDLKGGTTLVAIRLGSVVVTTYYGDEATTGTAGVGLAKALAKNVTAAH